MSVGPTPPTLQFNLCPHLSSIYLGDDGEGNPVASAIWVTCIENHCRLWDSEQNECSYNVTSSRVNAAKEIIEHKHDSHLHVKEHISLNMDPGMGDPLTKEGATATALIVEDSGNEDIDGNGYIYAKHFMIDPDDPEIPKMIASVQIPENFTGDFITWDEYLDSSSIYSIHVND